MAKKKKKTLQLSRRGKEKMALACRQFDVAMIAYAVLILAATGVCLTGPYNLSSGNPQGFAYWFLLLPAYLPLVVLSGIGSLLGIPAISCPDEAILLAGCDLFLAAVIYCWVRLIDVRVHCSISFVRNCRMFVLIMVFWGIFQIFCSAAFWMWHRGGYTRLNRHLKAVERSAVSDSSAGQER